MADTPEQLLAALTAAELAAISQQIVDSGDGEAARRLTAGCNAALRRLSALGADPASLAPHVEAVGPPDLPEVAEAGPRADEVPAAIQRRVADTDLGALLRGQGITTVSLDDQGQMVEIKPDGTERVIEPGA